jgi:ECF transporter S component (folate family)
MKIATRQLVILAFLTALSIILTRIMSIRIAIGGVEGIRIGFGGLPTILAGILFGPLAGGVVGAVSDILGYLINPMGAYMPHFTFTAFLTGFLPGFLVYYLFKKKINYLTLLIAIAVGQIVSSVILVPVFLQMLYGLPLKATMIPGAVGQLIHIPIYAYLIKILLRYDVIKSNCRACKAAL